MPYLRQRDIFTFPSILHGTGKLKSVMSASECPSDSVPCPVRSGVSFGPMWQCRKIRYNTSMVCRIRDRWYCRALQEGVGGLNVSQAGIRSRLHRSWYHSFTNPRPCLVCLQPRAVAACTVNPLETHHRLSGPSQSRTKHPGKEQCSPDGIAWGGWACWISLTGTCIRYFVNPLF